MRYLCNFLSTNDEAALCSECLVWPAFPGGVFPDPGAPVGVSAAASSASLCTLPHRLRVCLCVVPVTLLSIIVRSLFCCRVLQSEFRNRIDAAWHLEEVGFQSETECLSG